jgi:hypothetical protein
MSSRVSDLSFSQMMYAEPFGQQKHGLARLPGTLAKDLGRKHYDW